MGNALEKAQKAARKAIESTYAGVATVSEYKKVKDPNTAFDQLQGSGCFGESALQPVL